MAKKENPRDAMVSARLTEHELDLVKADAERRNMNVTDYLRTAILQERADVTKTRLAEIETRLAEQDQTIFQLVTAVNELRVAMGRGLRAVLVSNEKEEEDRDAVRRWVRQNLLPEEEDPDEPGSFA